MITTNRREQCDNRSTKQMAKIQYTQQEQDAIKSLQTGQALALNIKRINSKTDVKNYSMK